MINKQDEHSLILDKHYLTCDKAGQIISNQQSFFKIIEGQTIQEIHPFFESLTIDSFKVSKEDTIEGVHLNEGIFDIIINRCDSNLFQLNFIDVTIIYKRIQDIAQRKNESLIFNEILELKNELLKDRDVFRSNFLKDISYQLRNPLTVVSAFSSMLLKTDLNLEQEQLLKAIESQSNSMKNLIHDMVDNSSLKSYVKDFKNQTFDLHVLIHDSYQNFNTQFKLLGGSSSLNIESNVPIEVIGDPKRLEQAIEYTLREVLMYATNKDIDIKVLQTQMKAGTSSLRLVINNISHSSSDDKSIHSSSLSLGLSIAREIVTAMNGSLIIEEENNASCYKLKFKLPTPHPSFNKAKKIIASKEEKTILKSRIKTMVIEPNESAQLATAKILLSTKNFDTTVYKDVRKSLEALDDEFSNYNVVIISHSVDQMDAIELLRMIKGLKNKENKHTKYIALSLEDDSMVIKKYKKAGFHEVVVKPYTDDELINALYGAVDLKAFK